MTYFPYKPPFIPDCYSGHILGLMFSIPLQPFIHSSAELHGSEIEAVKRRDSLRTKS